VAIVTGASKGIGEAIARALAEYGARVVVSSRKQEAVDAVADSIRAAGGEALGVAAHAGDPAQLGRLVDAAVARWGGVDVVVNNAATNPVFGPVVEQGAEAFAKIMAVNVQGPLELARLAYPHMKARGGGSVVNISSIGGLTPEPGLGLYSVSKAALVSLTKVLAAEWGPDNVRANVVCPGLIKTKFSEALWSNDRIVRQMMALQPIKRVGEPEDVAGLVLFLASDAAAYCTGGVYTADGGYTI
jgi:NAD(P)-dependent dehydrogenase (short-subunit alcohol dehydrogenase family)